VTANGVELRLLADVGTYNQTVTLSNGICAITTNGFNATFTNVVGPGSLEKDFGAKLTLVGSGIQYTGATTITGGSFSLQDTTNFSGSNIVTNSDFSFGGSTNWTLGSNISGTGTATKFGSGTVILTGSNTYSGGTFINAGVLQIGNGSNTGSVPNSGIVNDGSLVFDLTGYTYSGGISGSGSVTQAGFGLLTLAYGSNNYTGDTLVSSGVLSGPTIADFGTNSAFGQGSSSATSFTISNGATLQYTGGTASTNRAITLGSGGGVVEVTNSASTMTIGGPISGSGSLTKNGPGTLSLAGSNTYTGDTQISAGTLRVESGGKINGSPIIRVGSLSGPVPSSSMVVTGSGSTIAPTSALVVGSDSDGSLTILAGGTANALNVQIGNNLAGSYHPNGTATVSGAGSNLTASGTMNVGNAANGTLGIDTGGTVLITGQTAIANLSGSTGSVTVSGIGSVLNVTSALSVGNSGTGSLLVSSGGQVSNFNGFLAANAGSTGTATITGVGSSWSHTDFFVGGGTTAAGGTGSLTVQSGGNVSVVNRTNLWAGSSITINGGTLTTGSLIDVSGTPTISISDPPAGTALTVGSDGTSTTFAGTVANAGGGPGSLIKVGAGTLTLTGNNSFSGGLTVAAGTLQIPTVNNAGTNGPLGNVPLASAASVTLGGSTTIGTLEYTGATATSSMPFTLAAGGGQIQIDNSNPSQNNLMVTGAITGNGTLTKTGPGMLTLTNANGLHGAVTITSGTLAQSGPLSADVYDNATFAYNSGAFGRRLYIGPSGTATFNADFTADNGMENDANLTLSTVTNVILSGTGLNNTSSLTVDCTFLKLSGQLNTNSGTLTINASKFLSLPSGNESSNAILTTTGTITGQGVIQTEGSGSVPGLIKVSSGGAILAPASGTLQVGVPVQVNNGGQVQAAAGSLTLAGSTTINSGGQIQALVGSLTMTGAATVNGGSMTTGLGKQIAANGGLTLAGGALNFNLPSASTGSPAINVIGGAGGSSLAVTGTNLIAIAQSSQNTQTVTYDLLNYTGTDLMPAQSGTTLMFYDSTHTNVIGTLSASGLPANASLLDVPGSPNQIQLRLLVAVSEQWSGANNGNWDTTTLNNWAAGPPFVAALYVDGNYLTFGDTDPIDNSPVAHANITITPPQGVAPGSITFTNSTVNYTFSGNAIAGASGGITLNGTGSVTLNNSNTFTGLVNVNAGQLILTNANALGNSLGVSVASGAALILNSAGGANFGSMPLSLAGTGPGPSHAGAFVSQGGSNTFNGNITLGGATSINASGGGLTLGGSLGGGGPLTKIGIGTLTLSGNSNGYTAATTISAGTLVQSGNLGGDIQVQNQATFTYNSGTFGGRLYVA
jgi:autotransporter-associated beta strand protein/T5SS/PEP-CTERM-associated repeat protein